MDKKGSSLANVVAIMGAVLIFVGMAWMIANNWHQIPDMGKTAILVAVTCAALGLGVSARIKKHEGVGRALLVLGALLYILSVFLISQIYHLVTTPSQYAMLMLIMWSVVLLIAYLLESPENVVIALLVFFPWGLVQYLSQYGDRGPGGEVIVGVTLLLLSFGVILYSMTILHRAIKHRFMRVYQFWTAFYLLLVFYIISFQHVVPMLAEYRFDAATFTPFLLGIIAIALLGGLGSVYYCNKKKALVRNETIGFTAVVVLLFLLVLSTGFGSGLVGYCQEKTCYTMNNKDSCEGFNLDKCYWKDNYCQQKMCEDQKTPSECQDLPRQMCRWNENAGTPYPVKYDKGATQPIQTAMCQGRYCGELVNQTECDLAPKKMSCAWMNGWCGESRTGYERCDANSNNKEMCIADNTCNWTPGANISGKILPTPIWIVWLAVNVFFIAFVILMMYYGSLVKSNKIINLAMVFFVLDILSRYI